MVKAQDVMEAWAEAFGKALDNMGYGKGKKGQVDVSGFHTGGYVAQDEESYRYLAESIRRFPPQAEFARMIEAAGLCRVKVRNLSGGIAAMHSAWRL